jgi:hypothetical protein
MFEIQGDAGGGRVVRRLLPNNLRFTSDVFPVLAGSKEASALTVQPARCKGLFIDSDEPVTVTIGEATFVVGPEPLAWTPVVGQGKPFPSGGDSVINVVNGGEKDTRVSVALYY